MSSKIYQMVSDQIIAQLEAVDPRDFKTPWFCVGHSPVNLPWHGLSRHQSRALGSRWPCLERLGHLSAVAGKDCAVCKGERSLMVVLWKFFNETDEGGEATGKTSAVMTRFFRVFNSRQVEGEFARQAESQRPKTSMLSLSSAPSQPGFQARKTLNKFAPILREQTSGVIGGNNEMPKEKPVC